MNFIMIMYGISNCDTVRRAKKFLSSHGVIYKFIDFRKNPIEEEVFEEIIAITGLEKLINRRSSTYRNLKEPLKQQITSALLLKNPTMIKRPVLVNRDNVLVGFSEEEYYNLV